MNHENSHSVANILPKTGALSDILKHVEIKCQLGATDDFLLQILMLAQRACFTPYRQL